MAKLIRGQETCVLKIPKNIAVQLADLNTERMIVDSGFPYMWIDVTTGEVQLWFVELAYLNHAAKEHLSEFDHRLLKVSILNWLKLKIKRCRREWLIQIYNSILDRIERDADPWQEMVNLANSTSVDLDDKLRTKNKPNILTLVRT